MTYKEKLLSSTTTVSTGDPLKDDFRKFVWLIWKHLNLPDPTPVQYDIAHYLQHGPKRSIIQAFRGVGKSWLTAAYVVWLLYCNPDTKIMVVSASKERADAFAIFVKRLIHDIEILHFLRPKGDQRDSNLAFDVGPAKPDQSPSVKSVGITGQLTGSRADVIVADDVEVPGNSMTQMQRDKLSELVKEFDAILKPLPTSRILYLGTPQTEMTLYRLLGERGYETRVWPAKYPLESKLYSYGANLAPFITRRLGTDEAKPGMPVDPRRFDLDDLIERELSYGKAGFALQFMLDTSLSDADKYPLRLSDIPVMNLDPNMGPSKVVWGPGKNNALNDLPTLGLAGDAYYGPAWVSEGDNAMAPYTGCVMAIDPSGRGKNETGYAIIKILHGQLFLVAAGGLPGGYDDATLGKLAGLAAQHKVTQIVPEANFGDGMFTQLFLPVLNRVHKCAVEEVKSVGQKELRIIDTLEPVLMQHRLIVDAKVIKADAENLEHPKSSLFYQLTRITRERGALAQDDRIDALAIAVAYWTEQMARDVDKAVKSHQEKAMEEELKKFMNTSKDPYKLQAFKAKPKKVSWIS